MPQTKEEIIKMINLDEPDYEAIVSKLTADDIPVLVELTGHENPAIATKAVSVLGLMKHEKAADGIQQAVKNANPVVRIAAAHALRNMGGIQKAVQVLDSLLDDDDVGVRKFALKSVEHANISSLKEKVRLRNDKEQIPALKTLSGEILQKLK